MGDANAEGMFNRISGQALKRLMNKNTATSGVIELWQYRLSLRTVNMGTLTAMQAGNLRKIFGLLFKGLDFNRQKRIKSEDALFFVRNCLLKVQELRKKTQLVAVDGDVEVEANERRRLALLTRLGKSIWDRCVVQQQTGASCCHPISLYYPNPPCKKW